MHWSQVALPAFRWSTTSSSELILQILQQRLHYFAGISDSAFTVAVEQWKSRSDENQLAVKIDRQMNWNAPFVDVA
jgi:hypothetical protein